MNTNKTVIGGIIGGIAYFILGYLIWGMLLKNFMDQHMTDDAKAVMRNEDDMIMWAMVISCLLWGLLLSYILGKAGAKSASAGASIGAIVSLLFGASLQFSFYSMMNMSDTTWMIVDILATTVAGAIIGAVIGWYFGMGKKAA